MKNLNELNVYRVEYMSMLGDEKCGAFKIPIPESKINSFQ